MGENIIFQGMSPNILGNVAKNSGECPQSFQGISLNILGMSLSIPGNTGSK